MRISSGLLVVLGLLCQFSAFAEISLPRIFDHHMVLQRHKPVPVWGWAEAGEKVSVELVIPGQKSQIKTIKADKSGAWKVTLDALEAGGPYSLVVKGKKNTLTFEDVLVGEVWICSGQSNMGWSVNASDRAEQEKAEANYPLIRHFAVPLKMSLKEEKDLSNGDWKLTTPETVGAFTAVGYFFGRELFRELNVPIGLINTSWGGTQVESWISKDGMNGFEEFKEVVNQLPASMDELNERRAKALTDLIISQQGKFPTTNEQAEFPSVNYNDADWKSMALPAFFDTYVLPALDGVVWFRKEVDIPANVIGKPVVLGLGSIDDNDMTYVNGVKVGQTEGQGARYYTVPANVLKAGKNIIAVRVEDLNGRGGFGGRTDQMVMIQETFQLPLGGDWKYRVAASVDNKQYAGPNHAGTLLYNSMIAPLVPYAVQGAIWYQGESNASRAYQYRKSFPLMINDWRNKWGAEFPFLFVQLASFDAAGGNSEKGSTWAELREAQTLTLQLPQTGMAVIHDIGESKDIHPRNKQDVGKRLALNALKMNYGKEVVASGPVYTAMKKTGNAIELDFDHVGSGLMAKDKYGYLKGFEVAGADKKFHWAKAEISGNKIVVWSDDVADPVAVHYGWADDNIEANLFNKEGLPAVPFRTDDWRGITEGNRFK